MVQPTWRPMRTNATLSSISPLYIHALTPSYTGRIHDWWFKHQRWLRDWAKWHYLKFNPGCPGGSFTLTGYGVWRNTVDMKSSKDCYDLQCNWGHDYRGHGRALYGHVTPILSRLTGAGMHMYPWVFEYFCKLRRRYLLKLAHRCVRKDLVHNHIHVRSK